jgi:hypothetical protein
MTVEAGVDMKADKLFTISYGLIYKCVCCPAGWSAEQVSDRATAEDQPGTSANRWVVTDTSSFDDDHPFKSGNPQPCNDDPDRRHWVVNC